jgi:hypothetical protein
MAWHCMHCRSNIVLGGTAANLQEELQRGRGTYRSFVFSGHGSQKSIAHARRRPASSTCSLSPLSPLCAARSTRILNAHALLSVLLICSSALGFMDVAGGGLSLPEPEALASLLGSWSLQLVVLNGCNTEALARRVRLTGIPHVLCWKTSTEARLIAAAKGAPLSPRSALFYALPCPSLPAVLCYVMLCSLQCDGLAPG